MKTNKEIINALQEYFLKQDPKTIARTLAAMMVDMNRMLNFSSIPPKESENLISKMKANQKQLFKFIQDGPQGELKLHNIESVD